MKGLLAIGMFVLAFPAAVLANTLDLSNSGNIGSTATTSGPLTAGQPFWVTNQLILGVGTVTVTTKDLVPVASGEFFFAGGTVDVLNNASQLIFQGTFGSGIVSDIDGIILLSSTPGANGISVQLVITASGFVKGDVMVAPEPGTAGLLASGLVGLARIMRRKLPL